MVNDNSVTRAEYKEYNGRFRYKEDDPEWQRQNGKGNSVKFLGKSATQIKAIFGGFQ
jgi:hypothetical protein